MRYLYIASLFFIPYMAFAQTDLKGNVLKKLLKAHPEHFKQVLGNAKKHRLQIIYTQIDRDANNLPTFKSYAFRSAGKEYFYPASLVKMPVAALALEKLNTIQATQKAINKDTPIQFEAARPAQTGELRDSTSPSGLPTLAHYIKKALVVSDNDAYNRLYEFLGQQYIQQALAQKGYAKSLISHRLSRPIYDEQEERYTNPCLFSIDSQTVWKQNAGYNPLKHTIVAKKMRVGKAYYKKSVLIQTPYNFKGRNYLPLPEMQRMLRAILFPNSLPASQRFALYPDDYQWLWKSMGMYPHESKAPIYNEKYHTDNFMKYFLKDTIAPPAVRIFNKVGMAFGFLIDNAYIVDFENQTEYMLSVVIYANADETLNDDKYDYESISKPFMQNLSSVISAYEKQRTRAHKPNLTAFSLPFADKE